jgi:hypothetical protein
MFDDTSRIARDKGFHTASKEPAPAIDCRLRGFTGHAGDAGRRGEPGHEAFLASDIESGTNLVTVFGGIVFREREWQASHHRE